MKTLKCDLCEHEAQGETFEEWMNALRPHYMEAHADIMNDPSHDHGQEKMKKWMADNKARLTQRKVVVRKFSVLPYNQRKQCAPCGRGTGLPASPCCGRYAA